MDQVRNDRAGTTGRTTQARLATLAICGTVALFALTILFPPWVHVQCRRREVLYYSREVKVYEQSFAGYDWLFADEKRRAKTTPPPPRSSGQFFDSDEHRIVWPVLIGEWVAVSLAAGGVFIALALRGRSAA